MWHGLGEQNTLPCFDYNTKYPFGQIWFSAMHSLAVARGANLAYNFLSVLSCSHALPQCHLSTLFFPVDLAWIVGLSNHVEKRRTVSHRPFSIQKEVL